MGEEVRYFGLHAPKMHNGAASSLQFVHSAICCRHRRRRFLAAWYTGWQWRPAAGRWRLTKSRLRQRLPDSAPRLKSSRAPAAAWRFWRPAEVQAAAPWRPDIGLKWGGHWKPAAACRFLTPHGFQAAAAAGASGGRTSVQTRQVAFGRLPCAHA